MEDQEYEKVKFKDLNIWLKIAAAYGLASLAWHISFFIIGFFYGFFGVI